MCLWTKEQGSSSLILNRKTCNLYKENHQITALNHDREWSRKMKWRQKCTYPSWNKIIIDKVFKKTFKKTPKNKGHLTKTKMIKTMHTTKITYPPPPSNGLVNIGWRMKWVGGDTLVPAFQKRNFHSTYYTYRYIL